MNFAGYTGRYVRSKRELKGITQVAVGKRLKYSSQFVANWERGVSLPPVKCLPALCDELDISGYELIKEILKDVEQHYKREFRNARKAIS